MFAGQAQYPGLDVKASVGIADFNGDGRIDLLSQSHFVLFGRGDGKFVPGPRFALPFASISSQTLADLNLDGVADWVRVERLGGIGGGGAGQVFLGTGDGGFVGMEQATRLDAVPRFGDVTVADVNHDGVPDLVTADTNLKTASVLLGRGDGTVDPARTFSVVPLTDVSVQQAPHTVRIADLNADGALDLVAVNWQYLSILHWECRRDLRSTHDPAAPNERREGDDS